MKECPYCQKEIQDEAIQCRFCAEPLVRDKKVPLSAGDVVFPNIFPGYVLAAIFFALELTLLFVPGISATVKNLMPLVATLLGLSGFVYWCVCVYRLHKALKVMSDNCYPISPARAAGYGFIPFYNIYWIFKWPAEILSFVSARSNSVTTWGLWLPGFLLFLALFVRKIDGGLWFLIAFGVLSYLVQTLKKSLAVSPEPVPYKSMSKSSTAVIFAVVCACAIPFIGLLAAIAIPNFLRARLNANEAAVKINLRTVASAAESYRAAQTTPTYPPNLVAMVNSKPASLDSSFLSAKHGYKFTYTSTSNTFSMLATPVTPGTTGIDTHCIDHEGHLVSSDKGVGAPIAGPEGCSKTELAQPTIAKETSLEPASVSEDEVYLKVEVDKKVARPNEPILIKYDLYTSLDTRYEGFEKEAVYRGFWVEAKEILPTSSRDTVEKNGKKYIRATLKELILTPINPGIKTIEPGIIKLTGKKEGKPFAKTIAPDKIEITVESFKAGDNLAFPAFFEKAKQNQNFSGSSLPGLIFIMDVSGSMLAEDMGAKNRLGAAKTGLKDFLKSLKECRFEIKIFAKESSTAVSAINFNSELIDFLSKEIETFQTGSLPDGTAMGDVVFESIQELKWSASPKKRIILLTDGTNNAGHLDPLTAADFAKQDGIVIDVIGLGRQGLVPFPVEDPVLGKRLLQIEVSPDSETLEQVAAAAGGKYYRAENTAQLKQALQNIAVNFHQE